MNPKEKAQQLLNEGQPPAYVARVTGIPIEQIFQMNPSNPKLDKALAIVHKAKQTVSLRDSRHVSDALKTGDVDTALKDGAPGVLLNLYDLANNSDDERVRLSASNSWLDRAGYKPVDRVDIHAHVDNMTKGEAISNAVGLIKSLPKNADIDSILDADWEEEDGD